MQNYFQVKNPDKNYDAGSLTTELVRYDLRIEDVPQAMVDTVSTIFTISGKSTKMLFRTLSLLLNPSNIESAIKTGAIPLTQGHKDSPGHKTRNCIRRLFCHSGRNSFNLRKVNRDDV